MGGTIEGDRVPADDHWKTDFRLAPPSLRRAAVGTGSVHASLALGGRALPVGSRAAGINNVECQLLFQLLEETKLNVRFSISSTSRGHPPS
jgi:hypothetical protein